MLLQSWYYVATKSSFNDATTLSANLGETFFSIELNMSIEPIFRRCDNVWTTSLCFLGYLIKPTVRPIHFSFWLLHATPVKIHEFKSILWNSIMSISYSRMKRNQNNTKVLPLS